MSRPKTHEDGCTDGNGSSVDGTQQERSKCKYQVLKRIGSGSFGEIYLAKDRDTDEAVAIKVEARDIKHPQLLHEYVLYRQKLRGSHGFPVARDFYRSREFNMFIMTLLGDNLEKLFDGCDRRFSDKTVLMIGEQLLARLETFHRVTGHVHRDIKPDNLLMGLEGSTTQSTLYLVDLGLSKPFQDEYGIHISSANASNSHRKSLTGTARYASVNAHQGGVQSRRDDLESAAYVLIYFSSGGSLPWQGVTGETKKERYEKICETKVQTNTDQLCQDLPMALRLLLKYVKRLAFDEKPDYKMLGELFKHSIADYEDDDKFDWMI